MVWCVLITFLCLECEQGLQREADFRYSLVRIRDNAESIAFYSGEGHESKSVKVCVRTELTILRDGSPLCFGMHSMTVSQIGWWVCDDSTISENSL